MFVLERILLNMQGKDFLCALKALCFQTQINLMMDSLSDLFSRDMNYMVGSLALYKQLSSKKRIFLKNLPSNVSDVSIETLLDFCMKDTYQRASIQTKIPRDTYVDFYEKFHFLLLRSFKIFSFHNQETDYLWKSGEDFLKRIKNDLENVFLSSSNKRLDSLEELNTTFVEINQEQEELQNHNTVGGFLLQKQTLRKHEFFSYDTDCLNCFFHYPSIGITDGDKEVEEVEFFGIAKKSGFGMFDSINFFSPIEISRVKHFVHQMNGDILVFGIGSWLLLYGLAIKKSVNRIFVVEENESLIKFFQKYILKHIPKMAREKIEVLSMDTFSFLLHNKKLEFSYLYIDTISKDAEDDEALHLYMEYERFIHTKISGKLDNISVLYPMEESILILRVAEILRMAILSVFQKEMSLSQKILTKEMLHIHNEIINSYVFDERNLYFFFQQKVKETFLYGRTRKQWTIGKMKSFYSIKNIKKMMLEFWKYEAEEC